MKKILVTGATGFVGRYVLEELLQSGYTIIASSSGKTEWNRKDIRHIPLDFTQLDNHTNYYEYFDRPDCVIHLAWQGLPNYGSSVHVDDYLPTHKAFLRNMLANGLTDLTVSGTCFEYGMQEGSLKEDLPALPKNQYGIAKNELRKDLEQYQHEFPFILKWVRLFYMYGKGQNPNSLLSQLEKALEAGEKEFNMSGGQQRRDYLPVETVAKYIVRIALQKEVTGIINCCSGEPIKVQAFVENYLRSAAGGRGREIKLNLGVYPYSENEPFDFWGDTTKLKTILNNE